MDRNIVFGYFKNRESVKDMAIKYGVDEEDMKEAIAHVLRVLRYPTCSVRLKPFIFYSGSFGRRSLHKN